jgi:predicted RNase H-like HicB family nuclease
MTDSIIDIEDAGSNFSAYVIGVEGIVTTGRTVEAVLDNMREATPFHLEGMALAGENSPESRPIVKTIRVAV